MARKLKTNKGAAKRFRLTKTGKVKKSKCFRGHLLTWKPRKRKLGLKKANYCFKAEGNIIKKLMPYS